MGSNLVQGPTPETLRGADGRYVTPKSARAKAFADELWEDQDYREKLTARIKRGKAQKMELYLAQLHAGMPRKVDVGGNEQEEQFRLMREQLEYVLREHPELARQLADAVSKRRLKAVVALPLPPAPDGSLL